MVVIIKDPSYGSMDCCATKNNVHDSNCEEAGFDAVSHEFSFWPIG
jgi:hypothetical protein